MDPVTLQIAKAQADKRYVAKGNPLVGPVAVAVGAYVQNQGNTISTAGTSRIPFLVSTACTDIRILYCNWYFQNANYQDVDNVGNPLTIKVGLEDTSGNIIPVTFGGVATLTIGAGGQALSDPISADYAVGNIMYVRTYVSSTNWRPSHYIQSGPGGYGGWTATTDLTDNGAAAIADSAAYQGVIAPNAIMGTPLGTSTPVSVLNLGDSIDYGQGDGFGACGGYNTLFDKLGRGGFWARRLGTVAGNLDVGTPGDAASSWVGARGHFRRMSVCKYATHMTVGYGTNDLNRSQTLAQLQANLITIWTYGYNRRLKVYQRTLLPRTTSTDGWVTLTNQTVLSWESSRTAFNDWVRDGAPILAGAPVATGSSATGTLRAGQVGHPLAGYIETADAVESARNSGKWIAATNVRTVTDGSISSGSYNLTSATAAWDGGATADTGRTVLISGAGASGATLSVNIGKVNTGTIVAVNTTASTTVSGATVVIGDTYTQDGVHPTPVGHALIAAAISSTVFS